MSGVNLAHWERGRKRDGREEQNIGSAERQLIRWWSAFPYLHGGCHMSGIGIDQTNCPCNNSRSGPGHPFAEAFQGIEGSASELHVQVEFPQV